jgi:hypothetical protein
MTGRSCSRSQACPCFKLWVLGLFRSARASPRTLHPRPALAAIALPSLLREATAAQAGRSLRLAQHQRPAVARDGVKTRVQGGGHLLV